jgi:hypothetical protein
MTTETEDTYRKESAMRNLKPDEIEVRVGTVGAKGVTLLLYKNARVDRAILDEEYGAMNWSCRYEEHKGNLFCSIGVYDADKKEWVWKEDCGTESATEKQKGEASDAFKRAGFRWGIGIELYTSPFIFAQVATEPDPYNKGKYKMVNKYELNGIYVSEIKTVKGKIKDLSLAMNGKVVWSTDRRKVGLNHE